MTAVIVILVIVAIAVVAAAAMATHRRRLRQRFGPEYDRAMAEQDSRFRAEAELASRQRRVRKFDIRPLSESASRRYAADWLTIQENFVDSPPAAVAAADEMVTSVMTEMGYPADDGDRAIADLSVDHARTVGHLRSAREITERVTRVPGGGVTEELRQALIHYRALIADLLGEEPTAAPSAVAADDPIPADAPARPADTVVWPLAPASDGTEPDPAGRLAAQQADRR